jgi:hypothetical protein
MHPLTQKYFQLVREGRHVLLRVGEKSGVSVNTQQSWKHKANPNVTSLEACLNTIGYELVIQKKQTGESNGA